jgi:hypothetical protein
VSNFLNENSYDRAELTQVLGYDRMGLNNPMSAPPALLDSYNNALSEMTQSPTANDILANRRLWDNRDSLQTADRNFSNWIVETDNRIDAKRQELDSALNAAGKN